jgi:hypothetical protein
MPISDFLLSKTVRAIDAHMRIRSRGSDDASAASTSAS